MPYTVEFAESVEHHFGALTARDRATVLAAIDRQLLHEPLKETRHRKRSGPTPSRRGSSAWPNSDSSTRWPGARAGWCGSSRWDESDATC